MNQKLEDALIKEFQPHGEVLITPGMWRELIHQSCKTALNDPSLRVKFIMKLRDLVWENTPKTDSGFPMVSDFDLVMAETEELAIAYFHAMGKEI